KRFLISIGIEAFVWINYKPAPADWGAISLCFPDHETLPGKRQMVASRRSILFFYPHPTWRWARAAHRHPASSPGPRAFLLVSGGNGYAEGGALDRYDWLCGEVGPRLASDAVKRRWQALLVSVPSEPM